jgi:LemA protein
MHATRRIQPPVRRNSGGASQGCLIGLAAVLLVVLAIGGCGVGKYNGIVDNEAAVEAGWSEIDNQYKRRYDLVPQLVATVKGAAGFEQRVLTDVTEARASVGQLQLPDTLPTDPAQLQAYMQAQQGLGSALGRLFAVSEAYPDLKATQSFLSLQDQLEGTENRIAVARRDYIDRVRMFNASIKKFPGNFIASMTGFEKAAQLSFDAGERAVPDVEFDFSKE